MRFNSIQFAVFLPAVFLLYWLLAASRIRVRNALVVAASYLFYGFWDYRFLALIVLSSAVDYLAGKRIAASSRAGTRKLFLGLSIAVNLGVLFFFKYFGFFASSMTDLLRSLGVTVNDVSLTVVLPVDISFYTFQTLSYTIDVYRRRCAATDDALAFFAFVSFFPQLVAGPIERAVNLLPQFESKPVFDYAAAVDGLRQILWGMFKKVVVADNCARLVNQVFPDYQMYGRGTLLLALVFFSLQIYGDFSGYSDIAIGTAKLFGIRLNRNFAYPYFSRNISEFWRRWHISLSSWFRDYVYIPLGGSRCAPWCRVRNVFIVFLVSGLWHGANWTFVFWGLLHALYFLPLLLTNRNRAHLGEIAAAGWMDRVRVAAQILSTYCLTLIAWVFFRSDTIGAGFGYLAAMVSGFDSTAASPVGLATLETIAFATVMLVVEWFQRDKDHALQLTGMRVPAVVRHTIYVAIALLVVGFPGDSVDFIYFQF